MHIYLVSQRNSSETKVVAVTLNLSTNVEANGYDEKDA